MIAKSNYSNYRNNLHTAIWYQVLQSNTNDFQTYIRPIDETLTGATTWGQNGSESNSNERVLHTFYSSKMKFSVIARTPLFLVGSYSSAGDAVSIV